ncbi:MAG: hypothetical protein P1U86_17230 [Verrucomicrobiales bacterium]|nr:hypothetical protein [Verrucomicrobiales bacterium]
MMFKRLLLLALIVAPVSWGGAEENPIEKIEGPVLTLRFSRIADRDEGSYSYLTSLKDGHTAIQSRAIVFRDQAAFDKKLAEMTDELGDPFRNENKHKTWKISDAGGDSVDTLIFLSPFSQGGPTPQGMSRIASLTEFNQIIEVFPANYNVDDSGELLNQILKTHPGIKMVSMEPEETTSGKYRSSTEIYHLTR